MAAVVALAGLVPGAAPASASAQSPWWHLTSNSRPSALPPGGEGTIVLQVSNVGDLPTAGAVTVTDTLPAGIAVQKVSLKGPRDTEVGLHACTEPAPGKVQCTYPGGSPALNPYEFLEMGIAVKAEAGPAVAGGESDFEVTGGEAPAVQLRRPLLVSAAAPSFGVEDLSFVPEEEGGEVDVRAGSHPFQLTATFALNQTADPLAPPALPKDLRFSLPPGLVESATAVPQCSELDFRSLRPGGSNHCSEATAIGVLTITVDEPTAGGVQTISIPLFNLVPGRGEPARFGAEFLRTEVIFETGVRTGGDYGVSIGLDDITEGVSFLSGTITFWGVPGESSHNASRGWACLAGGESEPPGGQSCIPSTQTQPPPFLTLPTSCTSPFAVTLEGDSWPLETAPGVEGPSAPLPPAEYSLQDGFGRAVVITGCNQLPFAPAIEVAPDVQSASTPSGLTVDVEVAQEVSANAGGLASSAIRDITIALPAGVTLNPAGVGGLQACSESQAGLDNDNEAACPSASKIANAKIQTPILPNPLEGAIYLATQDANPFSSLLAVYLVVEDPVSGTLVKLAGLLSLNPATGQITVTFAGTPQFPIENIELGFFGGERALLATPAHCGTYATNASFAPWSGEEAVSSQASFQITSGPQASSGPGGGASESSVGGVSGSPCPGSSLPFAPSLTAGTTNLNAGAFSPLTATISREDGQQPLQSFTLKLPPGLSGVLSSVPLCPDAQAAAGTCPLASEIGETTVSAGLGADPYILAGGKVYLTEKYAGAPFGLSIVTPVKAGPLDLENAPENHPGCDCLVIRAKIEVDPQTAQLTIATATIPNIIDGVPLQIKHLGITISRQGFIFNPTSCAHLPLTSTISGDEGASAPVSSSFQVANCASLKFAPKLTLSTSGRTSRQNGASLHVKLVYPKTPVGQSEIGRQANLASVKVDLPRQLVSRLATLGGACLARTFAANPAACPVTSRVGTASVTTPVLPAPAPGRDVTPRGGDANLSGPAYFVSRGGRRFPELILVLQGDGVTVDLSSETSIDSAGTTSSAFRTIPDVPVETFELNLPEGAGSALAPNGKLCQVVRTVTVAQRVEVRVHGRVRTVTRRVEQKVAGLVMPTALTAHNGAVIHQETPISVTGCPPVRPKTAARTARGRR
jgi:uncharacterized repeat protein (TIGR01451 family)